ncbi:MAG: hypothetical protein QM692_02355 [Thermomicrobiales bacterium]
MRRRKFLTGASAMLAWVGLSGRAQAQQATPAPAATPMTSSADASLRGARYCEILAPAPGATPGKPGLVVYNTQGLNACPADLWDAITPASAAKTLGTPLAFLNGPRYLAYDRITATLPDGEPVEVGGLALRPVATLQIAAGTRPDANHPYAPMQVQRATEYTFAAGKPAFELIAPDGAVYVMQTFVEDAVKDLQPGADLAGLAAIGDRLTLPEGWSFRVETPPTDLAVIAVDGMATVVRDDLGNTYQLLEAAP